MSHKVQHIQKLRNSKDKKKTGAGILKKAKKLKGVIKNVTADTYQRAGVATKLWETLTIPIILYGAEVFDMADSDKHRLEILERRVGRGAIGGNKGTGWEGIYGDLGWMSL